MWIVIALTSGSMTSGDQMVNKVIGQFMTRLYEWAPDCNLKYIAIVPQTP